MQPDERTDRLVETTLPCQYSPIIKHNVNANINQIASTHVTTVDASKEKYINNHTFSFVNYLNRVIMR